MLYNLSPENWWMLELAHMEHWKRKNLSQASKLEGHLQHLLSSLIYIPT